MEGGAGPAEMRPLGHRLEVVDRFAGLDLDEPFELVALVLGGQDQIGEHLARTNLQPGDLLIPDVDGDVMLALQLCL